MTILAGETPIQAGAEIIAQDVVAHVDGWTFQGINGWAHWIGYIRTRGRVAEPSLVVDAVVVNADGTVTARGRWQGVVGGRVVTSEPAAATYRLANGRIVEIWSTRRNYGFFCGAHLRFNAGLLYELLRSQWVRKSGPRVDLVDRARVQPRSLHAPVRAAMLASAD